MRYPLDSFTINEGYTNHPPAADLAAPQGTPVKSPVKGRVISVGRNSSYVGGLYFIVKDSQGYEHYAGHHSSVSTHIGATVKEGQTIAKVGQTGQASGPHAHYQIRKNGNLVNVKSLYKKRLKWRQVKVTKYKLKSAARKLNIVTRKYVGKTYPKGKTITFATYISEPNGRSYVRTRFDTTFKRNTVFNRSNLTKG